jgi:hypothetical protein
VASFITVLEAMQSANQQEGGSLVLSLALYNRHLSFGHDDICSFALVNKESKNAIQKTAKERRGFLTGLMVFNPDAIFFSSLKWHEHGSMCVGKKIEEKTEKKANLHLFVLQNNSLMDSAGFLFPYSTCSSAYQKLFNDVKIMENEICYYDLDTHKSHVCEYSIFEYKKYRIRECMVKINKEIFPLIWLVDFPSLFAAIFNAPMKEKNEDQVILDLNSAIIPDNFKDIHPDLPSTSTCSFEKSVRSDLQNAIIQRYQKQQQK